MNIKKIQEYLKESDHPDIQAHWIVDGFPLWLKGCPENLTQQRAHFAGDEERVHEILDIIIKEIEYGYITPVDQDCEYLVTMFCAQKKPKADEDHA